MFNDARQAAINQTKKFAEDCKCLCDSIKVWIVGLDDLEYAGGLGKDTKGGVITKQSAQQGAVAHEEKCKKNPKPAFSDTK